MTMNPPVGKHLEARKKIEAYYQAYRDITRERNLMLIDHHVVWKSILEKDKPVFDYYVYDGIHPGIIGCAKVITPNIIKALYDKP